MSSRSGGEGRGVVLENKQGRTREKGGGSKLGNLERTYFLNVPYSEAIERGHVKVNFS